MMLYIAFATFFALNARGRAHSQHESHYDTSRGFGKISARQSVTDLADAVPDPLCTHGSTSRGCWNAEFSIDTDFDITWPTSGRTRTYDWTVKNVTCNPDGKAERYCSLVNGQFPGPVLEANWGDTVIVNIHNGLDYNGTSIHWHGLRQFRSNSMDGVNGITECPIPPGQSRTYKFQATQFGTSWYHSHHSVQSSDGLYGPIVFHGPATADYDVDTGPTIVSDWYRTGSFAEEEIQDIALQAFGPGPGPDSTLINGTNGPSGGPYPVVEFKPGKTHRLRFINAATELPLRVSIDNHQLQVITADFTPIKPIWTDSVVLGIGQRYDVLVRANQTVGNYWLRAEVELTCGALVTPPAQSIVRYQGAPVSNPKSTRTVASSGCNDPGALIPIVPNNAGDVDEFKAQVRELNVSVEAAGAVTNNKNLVVWTINGSAIDVQWDRPTLQYVQEGNSSYPKAANIIELPKANVWTYWILQDIYPGQPGHPIHLHGHDFSVLGSGTGVFDVNRDANHLTYRNPVRRDTTNLPSGGWLAIAFPTDNPGAWLLHCHITWHVSEGLGLQFLETKDQIKVDNGLKAGCDAWKKYYKGAAFKKTESGL